jgi:hypothetical protein
MRKGGSKARGGRKEGFIPVEKRREIDGGAGSIYWGAATWLQLPLLMLLPPAAALCRPLFPLLSSPLL